MPASEVSLTFPRRETVEFFTYWTWDELTDPLLPFKFLLITPPLNSSQLVAPSRDRTSILTFLLSAFS